MFCIHFTKKNKSFTPVISMSELHEYLEVKESFEKWFKSILQSHSDRLTEGSSYFPLQGDNGKEGEYGLSMMAVYSIVEANRPEKLDEVIEFFDEIALSVTKDGEFLNDKHDTAMDYMSAEVSDSFH